MKRVVSIVTVFVLCLTVLAGCGSKSVDLGQVMDKINTEYDISIKRLSTTEDLNKYYSVNAEDVKQFAAEINQEANAPVEIVMIEAKDSTAASNIEEALTSRYNSIIQQYAGYSAENLAMAEKCKVTKDGNFVSMIVADKASEMLNIYYEYIK